MPSPNDWRGKPARRPTPATPPASTPPPSPPSGSPSKSPNDWRLGKGAKGAAAKGTGADANLLHGERRMPAYKQLYTFGLLGALTVVLLGVLFYFFLNRNRATYFLSIAVTTQGEWIPPQALAWEDREAFEAAWSDRKFRDVRHISVYPADAPSANLTGKELLDTLTSTLGRTTNPILPGGPQHDRGVYLLHVSVPGVVDGGGIPYLLAGRFTPGITEQLASNENCLNVKTLLDALEAHPMFQSGKYPHAKVVVLLDCVRWNAQWRLGVLHQTFVQRVEELVKTQTYEHVVVMSAAAAGEVAWAAPELGAKGQTVFGHFLIRALAGEAADINGDSSSVDLQELETYLRRYVTTWTTNHRGARQTPTILSPLDDKQRRLALVRCVGAPSTKQTTSTETPAGVKLLEQRSQKIAELWTDEQAFFTRYHELAYRRDVARWVTFERHLSRLEQLWRAGEGFEAEFASLLQATRTEIAKLKQQRDEEMFDWAPSLPLASSVEREIRDSATTNAEQQQRWLTAWELKASVKPLEAPQQELVRAAEAEWRVAEYPRLVNFVQLVATQSRTPLSGPNWKDLLALLDQNTSSQAGPWKEHELLEARFFRHIATHVDWQAPTAAATWSGPVTKAIQVRSRAEQAWAPRDPRVLSPLQRLLSLADRERRLAEDQLFIAPEYVEREARPRWELLTSENQQGVYDVALAWQAELSECYRLRDFLMARLPGWMQWSTQRWESLGYVTQAGGAEGTPLSARAGLQEMIEQALQLLRTAEALPQALHERHLAPLQAGDALLSAAKWTELRPLLQQQLQQSAQARGVAFQQLQDLRAKFQSQLNYTLPNARDAIASKQLRGATLREAEELSQLPMFDFLPYRASLAEADAQAMLANRKELHSVLVNMTALSGSVLSDDNYLTSETKPTPEQLEMLLGVPLNAPGSAEVALAHAATRWLNFPLPEKQLLPSDPSQRSQLCAKVLESQGEQLRSYEYRLAQRKSEEFDLISQSLQKMERSSFDEGVLADARANLQLAHLRSRNAAWLGMWGDGPGQDPGAEWSDFEFTQLMYRQQQRAVADFWGPTEKPYYAWTETKPLFDDKRWRMRAFENMLADGREAQRKMRWDIAGPREPILLAPTGSPEFTLAHQSSSSSLATALSQPRPGTVSVRVRSLTPSGSVTRESLPLASTANRDYPPTSRWGHAWPTSPPVNDTQRVVLDAAGLGTERWLEPLAFFRGHAWKSPVIRLEQPGEPLLVRFARPLGPASVSVVGDERRTLNIVFVLDCSGSMTQLETSPDGKRVPRFELAKQAFTAALDDLRDRAEREEIPHCRVQIMAYGHRTRWPDPRNPDTVPEGFGDIPFAPRGQTVANRHYFRKRGANEVAPSNDVQDLIEPTPINELKRQEVTRLLNDLSPLGETPLYYSMKQAIRSARGDESGPLYSRHIVVITDGVNDQSPEVPVQPYDDIMTTSRQVEQELTKDSLRPVQLHVLGFYFDEKSLSEKERPSYKELVAFTERVGASGFQSVKSTDQLIEVLQKSVKSPQFEVRSDDRVVASKPLKRDAEVELDPLSFQPLAVEVRVPEFADQSFTALLHPRQALDLFLDGNRLLLPKPNRAAVSDFQVDDRLSIAVLANSWWEGGGVAIPVAWLNPQRNAIAPRPDLLWAECKPASTNSRRYAYDLDFAPGVAAPVVQLRVPQWPKDELKGELDLYFLPGGAKLPDTPGLAKTLKLASFGDKEAFNFDDASFTISKQTELESPDDNSKAVEWFIVRIEESRTVAEPLALPPRPTLIKLDPPADEVRHLYHRDASGQRFTGRVEHLYRYKAPRAPAVRKAEWPSVTLIAPDEFKKLTVVQRVANELEFRVPQQGQ